MIILLVPAVILMAKFAEPIINIFYSSTYGEAALPMSILAYGVGFLTIFYVMSFVLNGAGKTKITMWISIFGVVLNTILNYILIKQYALVGSAVATTITSFVIMLAILYYIHTFFGKFIGIRSIMNISAAGLLMYFVSFFFSEGKFVFIIWSVILFALYLLMLYVFKEVTKKDFEYVKKMVSRKKEENLKEELSNKKATI
jgi:stage V sporulation protein B